MASATILYLRPAKPPKRRKGWLAKLHSLGAIRLRPQPKQPPKKQWRSGRGA